MCQMAEALGHAHAEGALTVEHIEKALERMYRFMQRHG